MRFIRRLSCPHCKEQSVSVWPAASRLYWCPCAGGSCGRGDNDDDVNTNHTKRDGENDDDGDPDYDGNDSGTTSSCSNSDTSYPEYTKLNKEELVAIIM